jgi:hypothetical protein
MQTETATRGERQLGTGRHLTENLQPRTGLLGNQRAFECPVSVYQALPANEFLRPRDFR